MKTRRLVGVGLATVAAAGLSGCFTGQRPTLADGPAMTGDAATDAVLERLDRASTAVFSVEYEVLTRFGGATRAAAVVQAGPVRRSITVGPIRFLFEANDPAPCDLAAAVCTPSIDAARISDSQLSPDFYASSTATRLRRDAAARVGDTAASTVEIAGQPAGCVTIPLTSRTETYCALDVGPVARLDAADVHIELTAYSPTPDEAKFARS